MVLLVGNPAGGVFLAEHIEKRVRIIPIGVVAIAESEDGLERHVGKGCWRRDIREHKQLVC